MPIAMKSEHKEANTKYFLCFKVKSLYVHQNENLMRKVPKLLK